MAKGINLRTRLSLSAPSLGASPTPDQLARAIDDIYRNLNRWSDALPFGGFGFKVERSNSQALLATGNSINLGFNTVKSDNEGWAGPAAAGTAQTRFYCPPGGSGWYVASAGMLLDAVKSGVYLSIRTLDLAGTATPQSQSVATAIDRTITHAIFQLQDGESTDVWIRNLSGVNVTPTFFAADALNPTWPWFTCRRISLL